jgi:hypothetical protein
MLLFSMPNNLPIGTSIYKYFALIPDKQETYKAMHKWHMHLNCKSNWIAVIV